MAKVTLKNLSNVVPGGKTGDGTRVTDIDVEIGDGEFAAFVGPPRSGTSTLLRTIAGLEEVSRGEILIGDRKVNDVAPKDREVAMVFPNYALYPHLSVYENVAFGLKLRKFPKNDIEKRVREVAVILGIEALLERKAAARTTREEGLRVAIARAIVRQPKVFLFDDPLAKLDATTRMRMRMEIARLHQRLEATMIYATRDSVEAMSLSDRMIVMQDGVVQQADVPAAIYAAPVNIFVAGFVGNPSMNLVQGTLKLERDSLAFREQGDGTIEIRWPASERAEAAEFAGQAIVLGIRPEDLDVVPSTASQEAGTTFPALLEIIESMGAETQLHLQTGAHTLVSRWEGGIDRREAGRRVRCVIDPAKAHLFDPISTRRIG